MTTFKLLHVSDLHLCIQPGRKSLTSLLSRRPSAFIDVAQSARANTLRSVLHPASYEAGPLAALAEFVYDRASSYDAIILSGDLSTSGTATDLQAAKSFVTGKPTSGWRKDGNPVLYRGDSPLLILPGNHDNYDGNSPNPNPTHFRLVFGDQMEGFDGEAVGSLIRGNGPEALILVYADLGFRSASEARDRNLHLYGGGALRSDTLRRLVDETWRLRRSPELESYQKRVIWIIHFAPFECGYSLELIGASELIKAAEENQVTQVLCGHTHKKSYRKEGIVNVFCAGSATSVDCANELHELYYDFAEDRMTRIDYKYSREDLDFRESF